MPAGVPFTLVPIRFLALGLVFLVGFRVGLNLTNSNVIDVGYSGVIGADRLTHGEDLYGDFPDETRPATRTARVAYYAYVPFELAVPVVRHVGRPAGRPRGGHRVRPRHDAGAVLRRPAAAPPGREGNRLGLVLAYAWAAYPYTLFVLNSNANDSLVALLVTLAFLALSSPRARGAALALAAAAKFAPLALVPLWASYDRRRAARRARILRSPSGR